MKSNLEKKYIYIFLAFYSSNATTQTVLTGVIGNKTAAFGAFNYAEALI